ncbi:hypothetical protein ACP70R_009674 [Stipagrostis hirtigluma subsp. patula]
MSPPRSNPSPDLEKGLPNAPPPPLPPAATEEEDPVVTKPMMALLINVAVTVYVLAAIAFCVHTVRSLFDVGGPSLEVFVWSGVELVIYVVSICTVVMLRKDFIIMYATDSNSGDLTTRLLPSENV